MKNEKITIRCLLRKDLTKVTWLDKESQDYVGDFIFNLPDWEEESDAYGLFVGEKLAAYFTIDDISGERDEIALHPAASDDSLYIDNVYVREKYRKRGYGHKLLSEVIKDKKVPIFLVAMTYDLIPYYEKIGFIHIGECSMVRIAG